MARILIVDDQPQFLKMLESILKTQGHAVTRANDAFDALDKIKNEHFEMVITDAVMPGGASGFDLTKTLRADPKHKNLIIILLTGKREKKDVERGIQAGVDDYAIKPLDPDLFLSKVKSLLSKRTDDSSFKEVPIVEAAFSVLDFQIVGISEMGLSFKCTQTFQMGSKVKITSALFEKVGIDAPALRVVSSEPDSNGEMFLVRVHFIGLSEAALTPLRLWIRGQSLNRAS